MVKTFTLKRASALLVTLFISLMATAQTVTYDFDNLNPAWNLEDVQFGTSDRLKGKIEDGYEIVQDGVVLTTTNNKVGYATRVLDHTLRVPSTNFITFKAPTGKVIKKIEFTSAKSRSSLALKGTTVEMTLSHKIATWQGTEHEVSFVAHPLEASFRKIVVTLEDDTTTGITQVENVSKADGKVYNLNGVVVGTTQTFDALPKGIYIVNGKKVMK